MKKILILNASPRKNGTVGRMLGYMKDELESKGDEVICIDVCKLQVRPCIACMRCRSLQKCGTRKNPGLTPHEINRCRKMASTI
ncbi:MAG: flavodoxin family protein [Candidatus Cryptobacteroides sp.]|nr:NAD(P)H-dependent oxidoreductase [Bacteroidales bacterium]